MVRLREGYALFSFFRPMVNSVCLAGDFNNWHTGQLPMTRDAQGYWSSALRLPSGEYRLRYWADVEWFCDFATSGVERGPLGWHNIARAMGSRWPHHSSDIRMKGTPRLGPMASNRTSVTKEGH